MGSDSKARDTLPNSRWGGLYIHTLFTYEPPHMKTSLFKTILFSLLLSAGSSSFALDFTDQGEYVGSPTCIACHERFYELWSTSHHGSAMQAFSGTFARTLVPMEKEIKIGAVSFIVELNSSGGVLHETRADGTKIIYPILHALGGKNVYFFLAPLEKGKLQTAPVAYHVHKKNWYNSTASMVRHFNGGVVDEALIERGAVTCLTQTFNEPRHFSGGLLRAFDSHGEVADHQAQPVVVFHAWKQCIVI